MKCIECNKEIKVNDRIFYYAIADEEIEKNPTFCVCTNFIAVYHRKCLIDFLNNSINNNQ